jgi:CHRD domain-containing protein
MTMTWKRRFIKLLCTLSACLFIAACGDGGGGVQPPAAINVSALLTRSQENPAFTNFSSSGTGAITVDPATRSISGVIVTTGVVGTAAHIHSGAPGVAGPIEIPLTGGPTVWTIPDGTVLTPDQLAKLNVGQLYYNVHSAKFPGGEIRGQLTQQVRFASLSGANETPAVTTNASGTGVLALNPSTGQISGFVRTTGITVADPASPLRQAHIHTGAAGTNGNIIVPLVETATGSGIWAVPAGTALTPDQVASFNSDGLYFNVHSEANPGGEIRGQILGATLTIRNAILNGSQETPPILTGATGTGVAVVNSVTREVSGDVRTFGIVGAFAAHIHVGAVGVAGPVRVNLDQTSTGSGVWTVRPSDAILTSDLLSQFGAGNLYFNVHSRPAFPNGEIRGQINLVPTNSVFTPGGGTAVSAPVTPGTPQQPVVFPSSGVSFSAHIQQIFDTYCIACHAANRTAGFMPLTLGASYANLVNVPAVSLFLPGTRVIAGNSTDSVLYKRVSGFGLADPTLKMPLGGPFLDSLNPSAINAIKGWIDEGARNN